MEKQLNYKKNLIAVDIDGTLTTNDVIFDFVNITPNELMEYFENREPNIKVINIINKLSEDNTIIIYTARDSFYYNATENWLIKNNVNFDRIVMNKLYFDLLIDDKVINVEDI